MQLDGAAQSRNGPTWRSMSVASAVRATQDALRPAGRKTATVVTRALRERSTVICGRGQAADASCESDTRALLKTYRMPFVSMTWAI